MLQAIFQSSGPVGGFVPGWRRWVYPHFTINDASGKGPDIIREEIKGTATGQIESGMMPMACQNAILDTATVQGESHVRTPVIKSVHLPIVVKHSEGVSPSGYHGASPLSHLVQGSHPEMSFNCRRYVVLPGPGEIAIRLP